MLSTSTYILRKEGLRGMFRGLLARTFRNCGAVIILNSTLTTMVDVLHQHKVRLQGHHAVD